MEFILVSTVIVSISALFAYSANKALQGSKIHIVIAGVIIILFLAGMLKAIHYDIQKGELICYST